MTYSEYLDKCVALGREYVEKEKGFTWTDNSEELNKYIIEYWAKHDELDKEFWFGLQPGDGVTLVTGDDSYACTFIGVEGDNIIVQEDKAIPTGTDPDWYETFVYTGEGKEEYIDVNLVAYEFKRNPEGKTHVLVLDNRNHRFADKSGYLYYGRYEFHPSDYDMDGLEGYWL